MNCIPLRKWKKTLQRTLSTSSMETQSTGRLFTSNIPRYQIFLGGQFVQLSCRSILIDRIIRWPLAVSLPSLGAEDNDSNV